MMTPGYPVGQPIWRPGLRRGALWGLLLVALDGAAALAVALIAPAFNYNLGPYVLPSLALLVVEALVMGWSSGRVAISLIAMATTAVLSTLIEAVVVLTVAVVAFIVAAHRPLPPGRDAGLTILAALLLLVVAAFWIGVGALLFRLVVGAGIGALGGWLGKQVRRQPPAPVIPPAHP